MSVQQLYPRLVVSDADAAIAFYTAAFGAELVERYTDGSGHVVHALLRAGDAVWAVKDGDEVDPAPTGPGAVILALYVDDPDAVATAILDGGGQVIFEVSDHPYGERGGRLADPFGHAWMVASRTGDLTAEEIQQRTAEAYP
ncbi:glyoxalase [Pseudonocardia sp. EC080610-09]|uniref:VOC family protein n=1 Tax=unclassified Pseudonocardia TaxID=2619320 RepID=UPI0006CB16D3|nr:MULTISPECIES: VOC family protein [unclassified Pseudonocardia]ALE75769.1 glyoxalase [Pseudonocardia sp. EC080625-04]ALL75147.1 glyoxalase [Pseudonocardia sp. EC080610-09]ALL82172.1 glyoxalase [Pseudonocardia sp. EC080619-01]